MAESSKQIYDRLVKEGRSTDYATNTAMRNSWDAMSREGQAELRNLSGDLWSSSPASKWGDDRPLQQADPYADIKRQQAALLEAQKQQRINALGAQRQSALSALESERGTVAPAYLQQRGQLSTTAQQTARGAEQSLAARGLTRGGSAVQGDIARNVALQQGMTDIGTAEAGTLANIAQRQTAAEQAYQQGLANAESETAATAAQNEIALLMKQQELQESKLAKQTEQDFESQKLAQMFENDKQLQSIKEAADEARAKGDFERDKELTKYKNDLEKEQIKLEASLKPKSGGGGGISASLQNTILNQQVDEIIGGISSRTGDMTAEEYNAYVLQRLRGISDPNVRKRVEIATGVQYTPQGTLPSGSSGIPFFINTRNLPGLPPR